MKLVIRALAVAALLLGGCTTSTSTLSVAQTDSVSDSHEDGTSVVTARKKNVVAVRLVTKEFSRQLGKLPTFAISVTNGGQSQILFSPANVTAFSGPNPVRVYTPSELAVRIKKNAELEMAVASAKGQLRLADASSTVMGTKSAFTIMGETQGEVLSLKWEAEKQLAKITSLLGPNVIDPGSTCGGLVRLHPEDIAKGQPLKLIVNLGDEPHEFLFDVGR